MTKYVEIDLEGLDIKISQTELDAENGSVPALFANIPIKDMKAKTDKSVENGTSEKIQNSKNNKNKRNKTTIITTGSNEKLKV